jgi:VWFA-related protein
MPRTLLVLVLTCIAWPLSEAAQEQKPETISDSMRVTVNEVILDTVVVDKKGQQVRDLTADDFQILEDGVLQKVNSIRYVGSSGDETVPGATRGSMTVSEAPAVPRKRTQPINLITLVFDRLSIYGRQLARQAGEKYVAELGTTDFVSVMVVDRRLHVVSEFSQDPRRLRRAIELATTGTSQQFEDAAGEIQSTFGEGERVQGQIEAGMDGNLRPSGSTSPNSGLPYSEAAANRALLTLLRSASRAENYLQGAATIDALRQVVRSQREFPGRKAIVFFAETLQLPLGVVERFRDLVSAANRAQISFYSIDTTGLQQQGQLDRMGSELGRLSTVGRRQQARRSGAVSQDEVMLSENTNEAIRLSSQENLAALAESTGGVMVSNTNDLITGMGTVSADLRSHYEISYSPSNRVYDGAFRKVEVRLNRSGLTARSREGYYALPDNDLAESPYEIPLLEALAAPNPARDFSFRSSAFLFPAPRVPDSEVVLYSEIPLSSFTFPVEPKKKQYSARVTILVAVKNSGGRNVEKFSQEFPLDGPQEKVEETRARNFIFYRTMPLSPGRYTVETAVHDPLGGKSSVRRAVLIVPQRLSPALELSSVILVHRLAELSETTLSEGPFRFGDKVVIPRLDSSFQLSDWGELGFFFTIATPERGEVTADMIIASEGRPIARMGERALPPPDERGEIRYVAGLPLDGMSAGSYSVEVVVRQGGSECRSRGVFTLN